MRQVAVWMAASVALASQAGAETRQALVEVTAVRDRAYFVDTATLRRDGDSATAWMLTMFASPLVGGAKPVIAGAVHTLYDCKARTFRYYAAALYTEDGPGPVVATDPQNGQAQSAPQGSVGGSVLDYVCFGKRSIDDPRVFASWRMAYDFARQSFDAPQR
jgi:hypothetical protein